MESFHGEENESFLNFLFDFKHYSRYFRALIVLPLMDLYYHHCHATMNHKPTSSKNDDYNF